ncbi:MAG TPA: hypothetical protein VGU25_16895 [Acidobacteriaceae bacterium]|nr:hypothetical protein [Acidobacteriaceae bacterium]
MTRSAGHRAEPPRPPSLSERDHRDERARKVRLNARVGREQLSLLRGLILLAVLILIASLVRAGFGRLFVPGWWRQW